MLFPLTGITMILIFSRFLPHFRFVCLVVLFFVLFCFVLFCFFKTIGIDCSTRSLLRTLVHVTMNVDSRQNQPRSQGLHSSLSLERKAGGEALGTRLRQNKKASSFMLFYSYIVQFLFSFSKTIRRCYRMNEARFSLCFSLS